jgi:hypothetical protein
MRPVRVVSAGDPQAVLDELRLALSGAACALLPVPAQSHA